MSAFTYVAGFMANGPASVVLDEILDATNADRKGNGVTFGAGDTVTKAVPTGTTVVSGQVQTLKAWTGTLDIGKTGSTAAIGSGTTPTSVVNEFINCAAVASAEVQCLTAATSNIVITVNSANTTGKVRVVLYGYAPKLA